MDVPDTDLLAFLGFVLMVSLSGVMMPGPVTAATIVKGCKDKFAGVWIALAHGVVEFPLIAMIYLGLGRLFEDVAVMALIGLVGGAMLIFMGAGLVRHRAAEPGKGRYLPHHPFVVGLITSLSNPYFFLWWATVGLLLVSTATTFGAWAVALFAVAHWSCDLVWDASIAFMTFKSGRFWTAKAQEAVLGVCGIVLICFGIYFMAMPLLTWD
jgi:threonine/homoserine/homoserine lactone efflux protein